MSMVSYTIFKFKLPVNIKTWWCRGGDDGDDDGDDSEDHGDSIDDGDDNDNDELSLPSMSLECCLMLCSHILLHDWKYNKMCHLFHQV